MKIERNRFFLDLIISNREETFFIRTGERENFINAILGLIHFQHCEETRKEIIRRPL